VGAPNGKPASTDAQSEQRSEVAGPSLREDAPSDRTRTERAAKADSRNHPSVTPAARSTAPLRWDGTRRCSGLTEGRVRKPTRSSIGERTVAKERVASRDNGRNRARSMAVNVGPNGKRATGVERRHGWLNGKSSEGRNPKGGCGVKQSHEARAGSNR
jgi:hypothetical protein